MEQRPWLASYPAGVPAEIDPEQYRSVVALLDECCDRFRHRAAFANMGRRISYDDLDDAREVCESHVAEVEAAGVVVDSEIGRVSLVGAGMRTSPGVAATVFETLARNDINIEMISTSAIRISCVVPEEKVEQAVQVLHSAFGLDV